MRRLVLLVSAIVAIDTAFYSAVAPLLPHYVDELDLSKTDAGILTGSYAAGSLIGAIPGGWLAGRWGVKPTTLAGLAGLAITSVVFAFAKEVWVLDTARFLQGIAGSCTWAGGFAWIVQRAPPERRGELIGTPLAAAIAGTLVGPVLGTAADEFGPEPVFCGVALAAVLLSVPTLPRAGPPRCAGRPRPSRGGRPHRGRPARGLARAAARSCRRSAQRARAAAYGRSGRRGRRDRRDVRGGGGASRPR